VRSKQTIAFLSSDEFLSRCRVLPTCAAWLRSLRTITALGNLGILAQHKLALFCSTRCPGDAILRTFDFVQKMRAKGATVISGFHSPVEKDCLGSLIRGAQSIIICPARSLEGMRIPPVWRTRIEEGRLLLLSPFTEKQRRVTASLAQRRNDFVAALADEVLIAYTAPGSKIETLHRQILRWQKPVLSLPR
jgi:predicted Rossmann fold nucleotide-binding protein DprA/Smf involved in DNA uptake